MLKNDLRLFRLKDNTSFPNALANQIDEIVDKLKKGTGLSDSYLSEWFYKLVEVLIDTETRADFKQWFETIGCTNVNLGTQNNIFQQLEGLTKVSESDSEKDVFFKILTEMLGCINKSYLTNKSQELSLRVILSTIKSKILDYQRAGNEPNKYLNALFASTLVYEKYFQETILPNIEKGMELK